MRNGDSLDQNRKRLAAIIREAREEASGKQEAFARTLGVVPAHLSRLENGQGLPSLALIERIANHSNADRMEMRRLLRRIKGFEDDHPIVGSACEDGKPVEERLIPVFSKLAEFEEWTRAVLDAKRPPKPSRLFPVDGRMTQDRAAFWFDVRDPLLSAPGIAVGDLLLVEPARPVPCGAPCFVRLGPKFFIARWCAETRDSVTLEPIAGGIDRAQKISKREFERGGGAAYRIAGIHPCYRPFVEAGQSDSAASV